MTSALDLVHNTMDKKPGEFQTNFSTLVTDKIADLIAGKRVELAQSVFGGVPPNDDDDVDPPETTDDDTDTDDDTNDGDEDGNDEEENADGDEEETD